ncbi:MAG: nuclear transport factor 2 family protein [Solirubrobacterales bacterium]
MSKENVDLILESFKRFEAGELSDDTWDEAALMTAPDGWPEQGPFEGRAAIMRRFQRLAEDWSAHRVTDVDVISDARDWVVVGWRWHTRGSQSGVETTAEVSAAFRLKDERVIEAHYRWNADEALEAAGLRE